MHYQNELKDLTVHLRRLATELEGGYIKVPASVASSPFALAVDCKILAYKLDMILLLNKLEDK